MSGSPAIASVPPALPSVVPTSPANVLGPQLPVYVSPSAVLPVIRLDRVLNVLGGLAVTAAVVGGVVHRDVNVVSAGIGQHAPESAISDAVEVGAAVEYVDAVPSLQAVVARASTESVAPFGAPGEKVVAGVAVDDVPGAPGAAVHNVVAGASVEPDADVVARAVAVDDVVGAAAGDLVVIVPGVYGEGIVVNADGGEHIAAPIEGGDHSRPGSAAADDVVAVIDAAGACLGDRVTRSRFGERVAVPGRLRDSQVVDLVVRLEVSDRRASRRDGPIRRRDRRHHGQGAKRQYERQSSALSDGTLAALAALSDMKPPGRKIRRDPSN